MSVSPPPSQVGLGTEITLNELEAKLLLLVVSQIQFGTQVVILSHMKEICLSPEILDWLIYPSDINIISNDSWKRPYEIWLHADKVLKSHDDSYDLIDSICTLKRSIDFRLKQLNSNFGFKRIPVANKPKGLI